jgi:hypothetical protein
MKKRIQFLTAVLGIELTAQTLIGLQQLPNIDDDPPETRYPLQQNAQTWSSGGSVTTTTTPYPGQQLVPPEENYLSANIVPRHIPLKGHDPNRYEVYLVDVDTGCKRHIKNQSYLNRMFHGRYWICQQFSIDSLPNECSIEED